MNKKTRLIADHFDLYLKREQFQEMELAFRLQTYLYNQILGYTKGIYDFNKKAEALGKHKIKYLSKFDLNNLVPEIKKADERFKNQPVAWMRGTIDRIIRSLTRFWKRKKNERIGFPRFKKELGSISCTTSVSIKNNCLIIRFVSTPVKIHLRQSIRGNIKTATIVKKPNGRYTLVLVCEINNKDNLEKTGNIIGLDFGLSNYITTSDGEIFKPIKAKKTHASRMRLLQRKQARTQKGSKNRKKLNQQIGKLNQKIADTRKTYNHQISHNLVDHYDIIVAEKLNLIGLKKGILSKVFSDSNIGQLIQQITYKAASAGKQFIQVDPKYTSQDCHCCGHRQRLNLSQRTYHCWPCGQIIDRDINAAINILNKGVVPLEILKLRPLESFACTPMIVSI